MKTGSLTSLKTGSLNSFLWVGLAGVVGGAASSVFSDLLHWSRSAFVLAYTVVVAAFLVGYFRVTGIDPKSQLQRRWVSGVLGGLLIGLLLTWTVSSQPASSQPQRLGLVGALAWFGLVYGGMDALLLSVVPVLSIYGSRPREDLRRGVSRLGWGLAALAGSLVVTAMYHLGFGEFRGPELVQPLVGNSIITSGYLLTGSPLAAIVAHIIMHSAAVVHGMDTTFQLPPHY
jgi:hypothetical protein